MMTSTTQNRLKRLVGIVAFLLLSIFPVPVAAQDPPPPFWYYLTPAYADNKITYALEFDTRVDWPLSDLVVQIALPPGTRLVEAQAQPANKTDFDGQYIKFYIPTLVYGFEGNSFTVEITDPAQTIFPTHSLISWQGTYPGTIRLEAAPFDITRQPLNWQAPGDSRLQLGVKATIKNKSVTYEIYTKSIERRYRMWDVRLNLILPNGAVVTALEAPPSFQTGFDASAVHFSTLELPRLTEVGPLKATLILSDTINSPPNAQLWATWKNGARNPIPLEGPTIVYPDTGIEDPLPPTEETTMLDVSLKQPQLDQQIVFDLTGDVPFAGYDLTSVALRETGPVVNVGFETAAGGTASDPLRLYTLYFDSDCNRNTGELDGYRGAEYRLDFSSDTGRAFWVAWDALQQDWNWDQSRDLTTTTENNTVTVSLPNILLAATPHFCWIGSSRTQSGIYYPEPPTDWITNEEFLNVTQFTLANSIAPDPGEPANLAAGKLAVPMQSWQGLYDVHLFTMADLEEIGLISGARQPNIHPDGETLLINHQHTLDPPPRLTPIPTDDQRYTYVFKDTGSGENIYEYKLADGSETRVSGNPDDSCPFYAPSGEQFVYGNAATFLAADGSPLARLVIPCGTTPSSQTENEACQPQNRLLASLDQPQGIWGRYPLWAANNTIIFQGCTLGPDSVTTCGLYALDAQSLTGAPALATPIQLSREPGDIPSDTKLNLIAFTSPRDGNWEAYLMNLDGSGLTNLSNNPTANDGLPTISPDGSRAAFVSDRDGQWAVWLTATAGGPAKKLFNLYGDKPLGDGSAWLTERLSWGN